MSNTRRKFISQSTAAVALAALPHHYLYSVPMQMSRKFRMCLNPGSIGVKISQKELLDAATKYGFEAIVAMSDQLAEMSEKDLEGLLAKMGEQQITWGAAGLPLDFRGAGTKYRDGLAGFPARCSALQKAGVTRMSTWIMPTNDSLTYLANFELHRARLKEVAKIAGYHGIKLGLEYVGPKTLMARDKYAFVHTLAEVRELIDAIDEPNVGVQLDSFHWYCAGETKADLLRLSKDEIVTVDLNDARLDRTRETQMDLERELPVATGVVDMRSFLEALVAIGYDGPVRAEPFNKMLNDMKDKQALETTATAMKKAVALVGG